MFRTSNDMYRTPLPTVIDEEATTACDLCNSSGWYTEADIEIHRMKQHKDKLLKMLNDPSEQMCYTCLHSHKTAEDLIAHIKTVHLLTTPDSNQIEREVFVCDVCNHIFFNKKMIIAHLVRGQTNNCKRNKPEFPNQRLDCPKCMKKIQPKRMWFHLLYHGTFNSTTCPICVATFSNMKSMMEHIQYHSEYTCGICGLELSKRAIFVKHVAMHKRKKDLDLPHVPTEMFNKYFVTMKDWSLRTRLSKSNLLKGSCISPPVHICIICRQICTEPVEMRKHILNDHAPEEEERSNEHRCECGEQFFNAVLLKHHAFQRTCSYYTTPEEQCEDDNKLVDVLVPVDT